MGERFYRASHVVLAPLFRGIWRVEYSGLEHVPAEGAAILASNHLSFMDHFFLPSGFKRPLYFISKVEHFHDPLKRVLFHAWNVIPLERGKGDAEAVERAKQVLRDGNLFCIYPEGTRSIDRKLHKGRTGVARLALETRVPVIPVAMVDTDLVLPKGKTVPTFHKAAVRIGRPIEVRGFHGMHEDRKACREVTDRIMHAIRDLSGQEYVDEYTMNPEYAPKTGGAT